MCVTREDGMTPCNDRGCARQNQVAGEPSFGDLAFRSDLAQLQTAFAPLEPNSCQFFTCVVA